MERGRPVTPAVSVADPFEISIVLGISLNQHIAAEGGADLRGTPAFRSLETGQEKLNFTKERKKFLLEINGALHRQRNRVLETEFQCGAGTVSGNSQCGKFFFQYFHAVTGER